MKIFFNKSIILMYDGDFLVSTVFGNSLSALAIVLVFEILGTLLIAFITRMLTRMPI